MRFLPLVFRNLLRRKLRTVFTILSVVVAFVLFGTLMSLKAAFTMGIEIAGADRLVMIHKVSFIQPLPLSYLSRITATEGVEAVTFQSWVGAYYREPSNFFANMAVDGESFMKMYPEYELPPDQMKTWMADRTGAIVGVDLARRFGWKIGDRIPLISPIYTSPTGAPLELTIDGIYSSTKRGVDKTQFFLHYKYLEETSEIARGNVGWYVIRTADPSTADQLAGTLDAMFQNSPNETKTSTEAQFVQNFASQIGDIGSIMMAIVAVVMFFILFVVGNTMAQSIRERINELGVLKTLGFGQGLILTLVLLESCLIAVIGGALGLGLVVAITTLVGDPTGGFMPTFYFPPRDIVLGVVLVLLLGVGTGIIPALQASRLKIVDALRRI